MAADKCKVHLADLPSGGSACHYSVPGSPGDHQRSFRRACGWARLFGPAIRRGLGGPVRGQVDGWGRARSARPSTMRGLPPPAWSFIGHSSGTCPPLHPQDVQPPDAHLNNYPASHRLWRRFDAAAMPLDTRLGYLTAAPGWELVISPRQCRNRSSGKLNGRIQSGRTPERLHGLLGCRRTPR